MNRIKELREARNIPQKTLAIELGVSAPTISEWETGKKSPSGKRWKQIADYFGVSVDYVMGREMNDEEQELLECLEELRSRPEKRMLFSLTKGATKADVEKIVKIIETLKE